MRNISYMTLATLSYAAPKEKKPSPKARYIATRSTPRRTTAVLCYVPIIVCTAYSRAEMINQSHAYTSYDSSTFHKYTARYVRVFFEYGLERQVLCLLPITTDSIGKRIASDGSSFSCLAISCSGIL